MGYDGRVQHLIIGAGFAGLCAAIKLQEDGERDFLVVEKGPDVGGTWRDNTYPGATCDIPSQLYSFSFATNPDWSSSYSPQPEIQAYIQKVAKRSGTLDRFVFDTTLVDATWDDDGQQWLSRLVGPDGERTVASSTLSSARAASRSRSFRRSRGSTPSRDRSSTRRSGTTTSTSPASGSR